MQRIIIIVLAILISLSVVIKSRVRGIKPTPAAFSVVSSGARLIRISGDVLHPGIYSIGAKTLTMTAIKMAKPDRSLKGLISDDIAHRILAQGDYLLLTLQKDGIGVITVGSLSSNERLILGIPLDINQMTVADFDLLPRIGPTIAQRIFEYRQKNGGTMSVEELRAVEGIGEKTYMELVQYF